jgi:hypothetical protein
VVVVVDRGTGCVVGAGSGSIAVCLGAEEPQLVTTSNTIPANVTRQRPAFPPCIRCLPFPRRRLPDPSGFGPTN